MIKEVILTRIRLLTYLILVFLGETGQTQGVMHGVCKN